MFLLNRTKQLQNRFIVPVRCCTIKSPSFVRPPNIHSTAHYEALYKESVENPELFWGQQARTIHWQKSFDKTVAG